MKMLVSDYDDTLYTDRYNIKVNVGRIHEFRRAGNIFTIATGRSFSSIKSVIKQFSIPYDYLICLDGEVTFNKRNNIIIQHPLNNDEIQKIDHLINSYNKLIMINRYSALESNEHIMNDILGYSIASPYFKSFNTLINNFKGELPHLVIKNWPMYCNITKIITNKSIAINELSNLLNLDKNNIYTIGNYNNDLEMIRDYNGYKMFIHHPILNKVGINTYFSVHKLIDDIMNNSVKQIR
jgi:HAD superfamily hydrolase (TIGR01484 family)